MLKRIIPIGGFILLVTISVFFASSQYKNSRQINKPIVNPTSVITSVFSPTPILEPTKKILSVECVKDGCSSQLCLEASMAGKLATTCEWKEEYGCYKNAECKRQINGQCSWSMTERLRSCLNSYQ